MKTLLDVHTHTVASGHAFSTLQEMAVAASEKGLKLLGITEHAPGIPGTCSPIYFRNLHVVPRRIYGVELLLGAELNIIDYKGTIDMGEEYFPMLDIRIAGIHSLCYKPGTVEQNTEAMIGAIYLDGGFANAKEFILKYILNDPQPACPHHQSPGRRYGRGGFRTYRISVQRASHVAGDQQQLSQPGPQETHRQR